MTYITDTKQAASLLAANNVKLIEFSQNIIYDNWLSQFYFDDFMKGHTGVTVQSLGGRQTDYLVIYGDDVSMTDDYFNVDYLESLSNEDLIELLDSLEYYNYDEDDREDMIHQLQQIDNEDYYLRHFSNNRWYDLDSDFVINGYSQGRNIKVKLLGNAKETITADYLTNLFFDAPIDGRIDVTINGVLENEIYVCEYLADSYNWDKDAFINALSECKSLTDKDYFNLLVEWLSDNLKNTLEYR